ncbi:MAG: hypothetical protein KDA97_02720 [Acidimicrobiales bacterium]|nr:hypothetical protein [Acidimicrobiales bacterium]
MAAPTPSRARTRRALALLAGAALLLGACSSSGGDDAEETTTTAADEPTTTADDATTTEADDGEADEATVAAWDADAMEHRGADGESFDYECPAGGVESTVWGTETYTDDSSVCTAAVQVGLITLDEGGDVTIEVGPGEEYYPGGIANGIESEPYGAWDGSFTFPDVEAGSVTFELAGEAWELGADDLALPVGMTWELDCEAGGDPSGSVWGSDPYTADSNVCTAAVHAGLIDAETGGGVTFEMVEGPESYSGSEANGVTSKDYGAFATAFTFPTS